MTAEEFRARWTGHAPKVQDVTGEYAVLVPLVERPEGLCLLYEVRADTLGRQPGEVCFPGGRLEPGEDAVSCALRETWEELAIPPRAVHILGRLDFIAHRAGFLMHAVAAKVLLAALIVHVVVRAPAALAVLRQRGSRRAAGGDCPMGN